MTQQEWRVALAGVEGRDRYQFKKAHHLCVVNSHMANGGCCGPASEGITRCERHTAEMAKNAAKYQRTDKGRATKAKAATKWYANGGNVMQAQRYANGGKELQAKTKTHLRYGDHRVKDFLFNFYGGISPLSGLPLLAPVLDHAHDQGQKVRGEINDLENLRLAWWCKDSLEGAHAAYAKLKDKGGVKGQFLLQAIQYLQRTPEQIGVVFTVIGKRSTVKWSKRDLIRLRAENTKNLDEALERMNAVLEFVA